MLEVLHIYWPRVVVSLDWIDRNVSIFESSLNHLSDVEGRVSHVDIVILPDIMWRVISSPEQNVRVDLSLNEVKHAVEDNRGDVAKVAAPFLGLARGFGGEAILSTATQGDVALGISTYRVIEVDMWISDLNYFQSFPRLSTANTLVQIVKVVVILYDLRFVLKEISDIGLRVEHEVVLAGTLAQELRTEEVGRDKRLSQHGDDNLCHFCDCAIADSAVLSHDKVGAYSNCDLLNHVY